MANDGESRAAGNRIAPSSALNAYSLSRQDLAGSLTRRARVSWALVVDCRLGHPLMSGTRATFRYRFGVFELDPQAGELWRQGMRVRLQGKPLDVLVALLEHQGGVVSRKDLQERLWPADTHVEFENGLNNAISRLREALRDSAESPRFIETVPRRGYRFISPVETVEPTPAPLSGAAVGSAMAGPPAVQRGSWRMWAATLTILAAGASAAWWAWAARPAPPLDAIAVLPFVTSASGASNDEYIAFGMTDAIIAELSRTGLLSVISQTSSLRYRETTKSLPEIARELGVGAIVEGSVVREGAQLRITVQLIDAERDTHLWADTYRRNADDLLATQGDLARDVAQAIQQELTGGGPASDLSGRTVDPRVREAYLKGRYFMSLGTEDGRARARAFFEEAVAVDPEHAPSHVGLADYYILTDAMPTSVAIPRARAAAERALALDDTLADGYVSLGFLHYYGDWDWPAAERAFMRALDLNPSHTRARRWYGQFLAAVGRPEEAGRNVERVLELDPVALDAHNSAGQVWLHTRRFDRLLDQGRRMLELQPRNPAGYEHVASGHFFRGEHSEALAAVEEGLAVTNRDALFLALLSVVRGAMGQREQAEAAVAELREAGARNYVPPLLISIAHLGVGDRDGALDWIERGSAERDAYLVFLRASPWLDVLRDEPRFKDVVRSMNFPPL